MNKPTETSDEPPHRRQAVKTRDQESSGAVGRVTPCAPPHGNKETARRGLTRPTITAILLLLIALVPSLHAQSCSIDWYKISGGGGTSTNGQYSVSGTIGQPDASGAMTGGNYSLTGGFWSLFAVQMPGAPLLTITQSGNQAIISWNSSATGWTLQTNNNLVTGSWGNYTGSVINNSVTNSPPMGNLFFRLSHP
jgi:hypothetical protein